ncbi:MAG: HAMP domain-containing sensor histidine kinase [Planctomycetota bacterium]
MTSLPRPGPRLRERGVLALGLASALALVVAAFLPANDPETVARTALAQLAARTEQAVVDAWQRSLRDPSPIATASSAVFEYDPELARTVLAAPPPRPDEELAEDRDDQAAAALLAEARRLDGTGSDEVEGLLTDALAKRLSRPQRVEARLLRLQRAQRAGDTQRAKEELRAIVPEFDPPDPRLVDLGPRVLLAAGALADDSDSATAWDFPRLLDARALLARKPGRIERSTEPIPWYRVAGLDDTNAILDRIAALVTAHVDREHVRGLRMLLEDDALFRALGDEPRAPWPTPWHLVAFGEDFLARRGTANGPWTAFFVTRDDLGAALVERLRSEELLPEGMELDFEGTRAALGAELRPRVELLGPRFAFTLRHADPEALVRSTSRRQTWLRAALFVLAAFAAGAGFAMARALRRERALAELKTTFIANVSHELRTPLASILLLSENLESGRTTEPAAVQRYHALIRREALRLTRLVDDVLDFSRLERGKRLDVRREEVDLRAVVEEWTAEFRAWAAEHGLELALDVRELPPCANVDREALRRALHNLLDNARKHSGSKRVRFEARGEDGVLVLGVADEGIGVPAAKRARVFEPFERLSEGGDAAPGTGLGLAIVREIAAAHGGTITLRDPERGHGAVFELRLPCDRTDEEDG